jgi:hypothetical protein
MAKPTPLDDDPIPVPQAAPKGLNAGAAFDQYIKAHPTMRAYASTIWKWSKQYGVPPAVLAALLWRESFAEAKRRGVDPETIMSPTGAGYGLAQINPKVHFGRTKGPDGATITKAWASNPDNAIRFAAWYLKKGEKKYASWDRAYDKFYNPGYTGPALTSTLPKGYIPRDAGLSPQESASVSVEQSAAREELTDPFVMLTKKGKLVGTTNPNAAVKSFGLPVRMSAFRQYHSQLNDNYQAYLGRNATPAEAAGVLKKGWSEYKLINELTKQPGFLNSPIWKSRAPSYAAVAEDLVGKARPEWIREAIVNNWDSNTFAATLRKKPEYLGSKEFAGLATQYEGIYRKIMGNPGDNEKALIKEVALAGWTGEQFSGWLRSQDAYKSSPEGLSRAVSFLDSMGMVFGSMATLKPGGTKVQAKPADVPDDKRQAGTPMTPAGTNALQAGYGG